MDHTDRVLIVDDEAGVRAMLTRALATRGLTCHAEGDARRALARLERQDYAVVVTDIRMPELDGIELLRQVKARWPLIEVIIITGVFELRSGVEAMRCGAYDYVTKPFAIDDVVFTIRRALRKRALEIQTRYYQEHLEQEVELRTLELLESHDRIQQLFVAMLKTLANTLEAKDVYTHGHSERVAARAVQVAEALGVSPETRGHIELAGLLHDIGKIGVRERILHKPGALTADELDHIRRHSEFSERILRPVEQFQPILDYVRHHHERHDGRGYPDRVGGDALSVGSRILAVCDAYDAMTAQRPYRSPYSHAQACEEIRRCRGTQFHPTVADAFLELFAGGDASPPARS